LTERGIGEAHVEYAFADQADHETPAQAIADEAAAGAYDLVVLARGYFSDEVEEGLSPPDEVAGAVQQLGEVKLLVA
jgi:hypothetical protein